MGVTYRLVGFDAAETGRLTQGASEAAPGGYPSAAIDHCRRAAQSFRVLWADRRGKPNMAGCAAAALTMFRTAAETEMTPDTPFTTLNTCNRAIRYDGTGRGSSDDPNLRTVR